MQIYQTIFYNIDFRRFLKLIKQNMPFKYFLLLSLIFATETCKRITPFFGEIEEYRKSERIFDKLRNVIDGDHKLRIRESPFGKGIFVGESVKPGEELLTIKDDSIVTVDLAFEVGNYRKIARKISRKGHTKKLFGQKYNFFYKEKLVKIICPRLRSPY